jgi:endonuclease G
MRNLVLFIIFVAFTLSIVYLIYQSRKSDNSSKQVEQTLSESKDAQNSKENNLSIHYPEMPASSITDEVTSYSGFSLLYDETHEQGRWVAYELTRSEAHGKEKRSNHFTIDPTISTRTASNEDYARTGYDRGHQAPAGDMGWSKASMEESFYYSNMSSQIPAFNRGNWKKLETCVRKWASEHESIYVATGPILTKDLPTIGPNAVSVPKYYYKVIIDSRAPELHGIGSHFPTKHLCLPYLTLP